MEYKFNVRQAATAAVLLILFFWEGCISLPSSPSSRFYTLQPIEEVNGQPLSGPADLAGAVIGVGPVTVPEYLDRPQMVTRLGDGSIEFAQFDRWAEPLDAGLARNIAQNLSLRLPQVNLEIFPWNSLAPIKYQVIMEVMRLDCRFDGETVFSMQYSIADAKEKKVLLTRSSEYREKIGTKDYAGLVRAIDSICAKVSTEIARALTQL